MNSSLEANDEGEASVLQRYRRRYRSQDAVVATFDFILGALLAGRKRHAPPVAPRRILLANAGHLGDAVMSTALINVIKHAFPAASLGFLTGSYSKVVIEGHPLLDRTHYLDHWMNSRGNQSRLHKASHYYLRSMPAMQRELREANYDVAIDLHAWMPNYLPLLWRANIPTRVGFSRVGFAPLLTHAIAYPYDRRHEVDHYVELLRPWAIAPEIFALARPLLAPVTPGAVVEATTALGINGRYRVLHPASSTATRDWTIEGWSSLVTRLAVDEITPVITGAGARDASVAQQICERSTGAINAVNKLSWRQLMALLSGAELVYSVETSIGHAAAAFGRPVVAIYGGMADPRRWAPVGSEVVTTPMACSPCFKKHGCAHRSCLVLSTVGDIEVAQARLLASR
jgi:ADP-heptose:LPS heptosyltransferase